MIRVSANLYRASNCLRAVDHFLHEIEITNFKSIRHQKIEGCKRINIFIGYPNMGKSNILEALSLMSYSQPTTARFSDLIRVRRFSELFFDGNISFRASIKCNSDEMFGLTFMGDNKIFLDYCLYIYRKVEANVIGSIDSSDWEECIYLTFENDESPKISENRKGRGEEREDAVDKKMKNKLIVKKYQFFHQKEKAQVGNTSLFFPHGENLFYIVEVNRDLRKAIAELFKQYNLKLVFDKGTEYNLTVMKVLEDDVFFRIPFYQVADTLQRLIFYKAAIASNNDTILLFEEPEAHMFPPYIKLFTNDIVNKKSNQYFIATHSPFVLNELMEHGRDELSVYTVGLKDGETVIKRLTDEELEEVYQYGVDLFFNLESYL